MKTVDILHLHDMQNCLQIHNFQYVSNLKLFKLSHFKKNYRLGPAYSTKKRISKKNYFTRFVEFPSIFTKKASGNFSLTEASPALASSTESDTQTIYLYKVPVSTM